MPRWLSRRDYLHRIATAQPKDMRPRKITAEHIREIQRLAARGLSHREIGRRIGVAHSTVQRYLKGGPIPCSTLVTP